MGDPGTCWVEAGGQIGYPGTSPVESSSKYLYLDTCTEASESGVRDKIQVEVQASAFRSPHVGECMWANMEISSMQLIKSGETVCRASTDCYFRAGWTVLQTCLTYWLGGQFYWPHTGTCCQLKGPRSWPSATAPESCKSAVDLPRNCPICKHLCSGHWINLWMAFDYDVS